MNFLEKDSDSPGVKIKAILFNLGSIIDYVALYFLLLTAIRMFQSERKPTFDEYGFIAMTLLSWCLSLSYEWKLRWARLESIVYIAILALILAIYTSIR
jgi:hypothetical protein